MGLIVSPITGIDREAAAAQLRLMAEHVADMPGKVISIRAGLDPTVLLSEYDVDLDACSALWGKPRTERGIAAEWLTWEHPEGFKVVTIDPETAA